MHENSSRVAGGDAIDGLNMRPEGSYQENSFITKLIDRSQIKWVIPIKWIIAHEGTDILEIKTGESGASSL